MDRCTGRHCRPVLQLPTGQFVARKLLALTDKQTAGPANGDDPGAHGNERGCKQTKQNELDEAQTVEWGTMLGMFHLTKVALRCAGR